MSVYSVKARLGILLVLALAGLGAAGTVQPAQAQFFGFWGYRTFHWGIGVRDVAAIVREHGMRLVARPYRNRNVYVADAIDAYGHHRRLIIDGGNGDVLEIYNTDAAGRHEFAAPIPPANIPHAAVHRKPVPSRQSKKHPPHLGLKAHAHRPHKLPHAKAQPHDKAAPSAPQEAPATPVQATPVQVPPTVSAPVVNAPAPADNSTATPAVPKADTTTPKTLTPVEPATTAAPNPPAPAAAPTTPALPPAAPAPTAAPVPESTPTPASPPAPAATATPSATPAPAAPVENATPASPAPDKKVNDVPVAPLN
ncbi:MAG: hypothetical protein KGQ46_01250 [Hyphomicrobiales bacterium]|nr:hypothetical protein [Hyphomicrobiales bacterium]MDE2115521.1 hypothetical protein [Hyphomicrobiales bacterium]